LRGYGKTFEGYGDNYQATLIVICDLDNRCLKKFREELLKVLNSCSLKPNTCFCIAVEEGEAWILGDIPAIMQAYPNANRQTLDSYSNDSICNTWEKLADAIFPGGSTALSSQGWHAVGLEKSNWAENICPYMDVSSNQSPSFQYFRKKIVELKNIN